MAEQDKETKSDNKPVLDVDKLKDELKSEIKGQNEELLNTVLNRIDSKSVEKDESGEEEKPVSFDSDEFLKEFKDELDDIRVDEQQAKGLIKLVTKILSKENPKVKKEIIGEVKSNEKFEREKNIADNEVAMQFPDILNPRSQLFKQAQIIYDKLDKSIKSSPLGTSTAVLRAASVLGIAPLDLKTIRSMNAVSHGGGSKPVEDSDKISNKAIDFAGNFGVKKEAFEAKLKAIKAKSRELS